MSVREKILPEQGKQNCISTRTDECVSRTAWRGQGPFFFPTFFLLMNVKEALGSSHRKRVHAEETGVSHGRRRVEARTESSSLPFEAQGERASDK